MRYISIIILLVSGGLFLFSCKKKEKKTTAQTQQGGANKPPPMRVDVYIVQPRPLSENLELPGSLIPYEETEIHPEVSGRVVALNVREGNFVGKGAVLAQLYAGDLHAQVRKLQ